MPRTGATRLIPLLAGVVRVVASVIGALIVAHAVFVFFEDLFQPSDPKIGETVNAALAALIWVVGGSLVSKAVVRLAPTAGARV